jgi:hypothetical protein
MPAKIAMIEMTTNNSIKVKAADGDFARLLRRNQTK